MARYLEYDVDTGKILCELISDTIPEARDGVAYLEVSDSLTYNSASSIIRDGKIVRAYETLEEKEARKKLEEERRNKNLRRVSSLIFEFNVAQLKDDADAIAALKAEFATICNYL